MMTLAVPHPFDGAAAPLTADSPGLQGLLDSIAEGAAERERQRIHPFAQIELIRRARLGALRIPAEHGGGGSSVRALFEVVIKLGDADANVAHILRNHFTFVEIYARLAEDEQSRIGGKPW